MYTLLCPLDKLRATAGRLIGTIPEAFGMKVLILVPNP